MTAISQPTREEALALMKGGLAAAMMQTAAGYVMPIFWVKAESGQPVIPDNGSGFMIDCGEGPFLVTNRHVLEGWRKAKAVAPDTRFVVGDVVFEPEIIAEDSARDVATIRLSAEMVERFKNYAGGKQVLTGSQKSWPPEPPQVERGVFFVGFPGDGRRLRPYRGGPIEVEWDGYTALAVASAVSDTDITLYFDHDEHVDVSGRGEPPPDWALGGCSGAPLLTFVESNGIFSWRLGGVIYEAGGQ